MTRLLQNRGPMCFLATLAISIAGAGELPEGAGKQVIEQHCSGCHPGNALGGYEKTRQDWNAIVARMGPRTAATSAELTTLAEYLAANFPKIDDPTKVNMNRADAKEISERLGLSRSEAEAIVSYRDRRGNFHVWGDLLAIYGVDGAKIEALQDKMSF